MPSGQLLIGRRETVDGEPVRRASPVHGNVPRPHLPMN